MGVESGASWIQDNTLPPAKKEACENKEFYITVFFSMYPRYDMLDPKDSVFKPEQIFNKPHMYNVIRWEEGKLDIWEGGKEKVELKKQDKVFYIDCSDIQLDWVKQNGSKSEKAMGKKLWYAVEFIKDFLNLQYVKGSRGTVHFNLCGHIPFDPLVFAMRKLFDDKKPTKYYKNFCSQMDKVFKKSIERYSNSGFSFSVDYTCLFEGYGMLTRPVYNKKKFEEIDVYRSELAWHNSGIHKNERKIESLMPAYVNGIIEDPSHAHETLHRSHIERLKKLELESFFYQSGGWSNSSSNPNERKDKIFYHGRPYSLEELNELYNYHKEEWWKEGKSPSLAEQIKKWLKEDKQMREWEEFQVYVQGNAEVHAEGEAKQQMIREAREDLKAQNNNESDNNEAYEIGKQIHEAEGTAKYYHDISKIEFESQYVDLKKLNDRYDRYGNSIKASDEFTLQKEKESEERIAWYPLEVIWSIIRIAIGIASIFFPVLILVDLGLELIQLGIKLGVKQEPFQWTDLIGAGIDILCLWALRGGSVKTIFKGLNAPVQGTSEAAKNASAAAKTGMDNTIAGSKKLVNETTNEIIAQTAKWGQLPKNAAKEHAEMKQLFEKLKTREANYQEIVNNYNQGYNNLGYIAYQSETSTMKPIGKFIEDSKLFLANYNNLSKSARFQYVFGTFVQFGGNVNTIKGVADNTANLIKKHASAADYTLYDVSDNSIIMIQ